MNSNIVWEKLEKELWLMLTFGLDLSIKELPAVLKILETVMLFAIISEVLVIPVYSPYQYPLMFLITVLSRIINFDKD